MTREVPNESPRSPLISTIGTSEECDVEIKTENLLESRIEREAINPTDTTTVLQHPQRQRTFVAVYLSRRPVSIEARLKAGNAILDWPETRFWLLFIQ